MRSTKLGKARSLYAAGNVDRLRDPARSHRQREEGDGERHDQKAQRAPANGQDTACLLLGLVSIAPPAPDRDERQDQHDQQDQRAIAPGGRGDENAAIGDGDGIAEDHRRAAAFAEIARLRRGLCHQREDQQNPQQHRDVAEAFDIDRHQLGDEPVLGQAQHARQNSDDGGEHAAQRRDQQRVEDAHERGAAMGRSAVVFDQALVDVIARALAQKAEVEILAERGEVGDRVRHQPAQPQHQRDEGNYLDGQGAVAGVVDQLARAKPGLRRIRGRCHVLVPVGPRAGLAPVAPAAPC